MLSPAGHRFRPQGDRHHQANVGVGLSPLGLCVCVMAARHAPTRRRQPVIDFRLKDAPPCRIGTGHTLTAVASVRYKPCEAISTIRRVTCNGKLGGQPKFAAIADVLCIGANGSHGARVRCCWPRGARTTGSFAVGRGYGGGRRTVGPHARSWTTAFTTIVCS
jgi:hypothetical protein